MAKRVRALRWGDDVLLGVIPRRAKKGSGHERHSAGGDDSYGHVGK